MNRFLLLWLLLCLVSQSFGLQAGKYKITSFSRVFYDDNVFMRAAGTTNQIDTLYLSQSLGIDANFFRDTINVKATPEVRHRLVDNKTLYFGGITGKGKFRFGPTIEVEVNEKFQHSEREPSSLDDDIDVTYFQNKTSGKVSWQPTYLNKFRFEYENAIKRWSENLPLGNDLTNGDYTKNTHSLTLERIHNRRFISELIGSWSDLAYNGNRGGYDSRTVNWQLTYVPNSFMVIKGMYGQHYSDVLNQAGNIYSATRPVYGANVTFFTPRGTTLGFNLIYDVTDSGAGYWNAKENRKAMVIAKYPFTPKTEISFMGLWMQTEYFAEYNRYEGLDLERLEDIFVSSVTLSWNYNRNHYAEIGYQGMHLFNKDADVFKNKVFIGYRLKF